MTPADLRLCRQIAAGYRELELPELAAAVERVADAAAINQTQKEEHGTDNPNGEHSQAGRLSARR